MMLSNALWNKYLWVNDIEHVPEAFTLSIIVPGRASSTRADGLTIVRDSEWIAAQFGAPTKLEDMTVSSAVAAVMGDEDDQDCGNGIVQVLEFQGCHLALEVNGWDGVSEPVCARLSTDSGVVGSYYQSVNMDMLCTLARDGVIERTFDPLLTPRDTSRENERDLPFGEEKHTESIPPAVFLLLERHTGVTITPDMFSGKLWEAYQKTV